MSLECHEIMRSCRGHKVLIAGFKERKTWVGDESKITVDVDLGIKGIEKTEMFVYLNGKWIETHGEKSYDDIRKVVNDLKARYEEAEVEVTCEGEDFWGRIHKWPLDV